MRAANQFNYLIDRIDLWNFIWFDFHSGKSRSAFHFIVSTLKAYRLTFNSSIDLYVIESRLRFQIKLKLYIKLYIIYFGRSTFARFCFLQWWLALKLEFCMELWFFGTDFCFLNSDGYINQAFFAMIGNILRKRC